MKFFYRFFLKKQKKYAIIIHGNIISSLKFLEYWKGCIESDSKQLRRILFDKDDLELIQDIFRLVILAKRNLYIAQLEVALSLSLPLKLGLAKRTKYWNIEKTLSACEAFIRVMQLGEEEDEKLVNLVHDSFKVFITNKELCGEIFVVVESMSNPWIVKTCLSYITTEEMPRYQDIYVPKQRRRKLNVEHPLFSYATLHWSSHLLDTLNGGRIEKQIIIEILQSFFTPERFWIYIRSVLAYSDQSIYVFQDSRLYSVVFEDALDWLQNDNIELELESIESWKLRIPTTGLLFHKREPP